LLEQDFLYRPYAFTLHCRQTNGVKVMKSEIMSIVIPRYLNTSFTAHHCSLFSSHGGAAELVCGQRQFVELESAQSSTVDVGWQGNTFDFTARDRSADIKGVADTFMSPRRLRAGSTSARRDRPAISFPFPVERQPTSRLLIGSRSSKTATRLGSL